MRQVEKSRTAVSGLGGCGWVEAPFAAIENIGGRASGRWGAPCWAYRVDVLVEYPGRNLLSDGGAKV